jgi:AcrR family transcriptional regulator
VPKFVAIPGASDDARSVRTRADLAAALIALMHTTAFDGISVQAICARAGVGRSTFYAHFHDKDDLFIRHTHVFARQRGLQLRWDEAIGGYRFPAQWMFEHVRRMKPVFESLARARKTEFIMKVWQNTIAEAFGERIDTIRSEARRASEIPAVLLAQQLAGTLITLMVWWMDHHFPIAESAMDEQFHRMIAGLK